VEHNRSNSQTNERQSSYSNSTSINKTIPVGLLFFPKLAEYERAIWTGVHLSASMKSFDEIQNQIDRNHQDFFRKKTLEGKMRDSADQFLTTTCDVFSTTGRVVWSHDQNRSVTANNTNGLVNFNEGTYAPGSGDTANYSPLAVGMLGYPVFAGEHARCTITYAMLIDSAIDRMLKKGAHLKGQNLSMKNIEEEAEKALWDSFYTLNERKRYDIIPRGQQCTIPTAEGTNNGGPKEYRCGDITTSQSPLKLTRSGIVILDQNTVNGRSYLFSESTTSANSNSNKRSNTRGTTQRANVAN
jgi:hypothetical protein